MTLPDALRILWHHHTNHPRKRWFFKPTGAPPSEEVDEACNLLAISPPEEVIPDLAGIIWNAEASLREKLGSIFMTLASRMPAGSWPLADSDIRTSHRFHQNPSRDFPDEEMQICPALIIIGLCHPSGRTREKAISSSKHLVPSLSAPLLMIRVNDWVTPIRKTTASQLANCLKALGAEEKMTLVPLLARVRQGGRHEGTLQFDQWEKILGTPFDEPVWLRSWAKAKGRQRRDYFGILKTSGHAPGVSLRRSLLSSNDRMILVWLIRELLPTLNEHDRSEALLSIRKSKVAAVRRELLSFALETQSAREMELALHDMLLDRSGGNRQFARYHLSRIAPMDFAAFYHTALADVATEAKALYALSEIAPDEAHLAAEARLASTSRAVLKAALATLSSEHLYRHRELLIRSIDSNVPGVAKIAGKRLFEIRRLLGIDLVERPELWSEFSETMKRQAIRMATGFQKWDGLEFLIVTSNYQQFLEDVILTLEQWLQKERRVHAKLAPARYTKLQNRLLESQLPTNMIKQLDFVMSHN